MGEYKWREDEEEHVSRYRRPYGNERALKIERETLNSALWRTRFVRGYEPVMRQTAESMNKIFTDY